MNITVIGCGYVGLVTAAGLAELGHTVTGIDNDHRKIEMLNQGLIPIYEKGLTELVKNNMQKNRLSFLENLKTGTINSNVIFIAVGTPPQEDGSADLSQVKAVAREIAETLLDYTIIVNKSTVPVGTARLVQKIIAENRKAPVNFDVASNPEFLREGSAVNDFLNPDRVVIGTDSPKVKENLKAMYQSLLERNIPIIATNWETAELIKYASNAFLATKISFINEIADLCETVGADVEMVAKGMGTDKRIGPYFLKVGPGYGGSCFPKDIKALIAIARNCEERAMIVEATDNVNKVRQTRIVKKIERVLGDLKDKILCFLGLTFKSDTDDLRESPSVSIIKQLLVAGARITVHDPQGISEAKKIFGDQVRYGKDEYDAAIDTNALIIATDWDLYRKINFNIIKQKMKQPVVIDLRNLYDPLEMTNLGFRYEGIGCGVKIPR